MYSPHIATMAESELEMAERHVSEQKDRILKQHAVIGRLGAHRIPTALAELVLASMEELLVNMQAHVTRLKAQ